MLMIYWVNMNLLSHSLVSREAKREGDEEPVKAWIEHNDDCHLMNRKIDVMGPHMGIPSYPVGEMQEEVTRPHEMGNHHDKVHCNEPTKTLVEDGQMGNPPAMATATRSRLGNAI